MAQTMLRDYLQQTEDALSSGRIDDALAHCQQVLTHFPESLEAQRLLGEVYLAQGHLEEAQQTFDWVLTSDPENVVAYCDRALISERISDFDTALDCYQQAYELSRGNSQIRQEFNQLSTKVGQPHFMFSRAGLARLYMRGDLLLQAIQEWEIVLTATPDRLDARTGLLEALWREGLNDRVEHLAKQILDETPSCLKALLLLAYVTSTHNIPQARELLGRAEALDPELVMANELFSDLMACQPNDPFLPLIKKGPVTFPEVTPGPLAPTVTTVATATTTAEGSGITNGTSNPSMSADPLFDWSSLDPVMKQQKNQQESPEYTVWSSSDLEAFDSKKAELKDTDLPTPPAWMDMLTRGEQRPSSGALPDLSSAPSTEQEPLTAMPSVTPPVEPEPQVPHEEIPHSAPLTPLMFTPEDSDAANWPEWLKSLGATAMESESEPEAPMIVHEPPQPLYTQPWLEQATQSPAQQIPSPTWSHQVIEPPAQQVLSPAWMDQMAASFAQQAPSLSRPDQVVEPPAQQTTPAWMDQMAASFAQQAPSLSRPDQVVEPPAQQTSPAWMDRGTRPLPEAEQHTPVTLENLEQSLHAQGFVELAPGSLSTIAHSTQEPTLSSALAQLGDLHLSSAPPPVIPSYRADALLENELETTMKRPAVRLQPMQQRPTAQQDAAPLISKGRSGERPLGGGAAEGNLSPRERLLKGYQYQLAGDYDEAMQEYRIIIRSTSELLGDVVSNTRALLKLAPKYAAGYRVLGDAYMRQGEYLQAMEAYNKALSMSRKAKGQGL